MPASEREDLDEPSVQAIARALSAWFAEHARDLPWRRTHDPYAIWVSEVMLQQTRVETVESYWSRFLERFPDLASLAAADEQDVLAQWSGLGYYRRARLLHRGARFVHEQLGGELPADPAELRAIPGIGRYTAGAIASIAFDRPAPLVDGNVARVHARLAALEDPREQDAGFAGHWELVARVLEHGSPRVLAQALMELGATVCTPRSPTCLTCPVRPRCRAHARGLEQVIPAVKLKRPPPELHFWAVALHRDAGAERTILLERRAEEGLLAGLWCLPLFEREAGPLPRGRALARARRELSEQASARLGVALELAEQPLAQVRHVFSHRVWLMHPWPAVVGKRARVRAREPEQPSDAAREWEWVEGGKPAKGGVPTLTRKLLAALDER